MLDNGSEIPDTDPIRYPPCDEAFLNDIMKEYRTAINKGDDKSAEGLRLTCLLFQVCPTRDVALTTS